MSEVVAMFKTCTKCGEDKPLSAFYAQTGGRSGVASRCKACVAAYHAGRRQNPGIKDAMNARRRKWRQDGGDTEWRRAYDRANYRTIRGRLHKSLKVALRRRPSNNPATIDLLMSLWDRQGGCCAITGIPMTWVDSGGHAQPTSVSIDRIDGLRPYDADNVRLVCFAFNVCRANNPDDETINFFLRLADVLRERQEPRRLAVVNLS